MTPRVLCLRDIVVGLEPMLRRLISEVVAFRIETAADTGNVRADPNQLEQVLMNLVVNARDAMPTGGTLTIQTGNQTLDKDYCHAHPGVSPGDYVMLSVTDTGMGMTPDTVSRLFEPFFTTKPPGQGTGLGLAMCHGIVRECGGHIAVTSREGLGTTMKIYLPRARGEAPATSPSPEAPSAGGTETVLLVEGSSMVRELIAGGLRAAGYTVIAAPGGEEAMRAAQMHSGRIDLLVTVVVMPGITGVQLAQALERLHGVARVIYISGYSEEAGSVPGPETGKTAFISKPFTTDALLQKVRFVLGTSTANGS
jgi:CheY-like chemotaxis protein